MQENRLIKCIKKEPIDQKPIWLMRQAGRYLPEYRKLRQHYDSFIEFCLTPTAACEATLQPIRQFDFDAAILFADILLIPYAMGQNVYFKAHIGPVLDPIKSLDALSVSTEALSPVYEAVSLVRQQLSPDKALIGFSGGLWSVACYMIHGQGHEGFKKALYQVHHDPSFVQALFEKLEIVTADYLIHQIEEGAGVIQIFESHAGLLEGADFDRFVIDPTCRLIQRVKEQYPDIPFIGFPRGASLEDYKRYALNTGLDVLSVDHFIDRKAVRRACPDMVFQGNLDPKILLQGGCELAKEVIHIQNDFNGNHIFNLGHGVLPETPPEHVAQLVALVRG